MLVMRRRLVAYIQIGFLFFAGIYLLLKFDTYSIPALSDSNLFKPSEQGLDPLSHNGAEVDSSQPAPVADNRPNEYTPKVAATIPWAPKETTTTQAATVTTEAAAATAASQENKDQGKDGKESEKPTKAEGEQKAEEDGSTPTSASSTATPTLTREELLAKAQGLIPSILDPSDTSIDRMTCPAINETRYSYLKVSKWEREVKYFFALNLRQCVDLLPRLMGSVLEAMRFLGPSNCALSIVEGNSADGTLEVLELLKEELDRMGVYYRVTSSKLNPSESYRIEKLAMLRAMAVEPVTGPLSEHEEYFDKLDAELKKNKTLSARSSSGSDELPRTPVEKLNLADDAVVLFLNDVAACAEDILELLHQRLFQEADMTCAMDWSHIDPNGLFYDVWVSRAINGDLFFNIPAVNTTWDYAKKLFWNEPLSKARFEATRPFQVFACWNGAVAFTAKPLVKNEVRFRSSMKKECFQGEPQLFCKDMWWAGYGKIAVIPSVNLEYTDKLGRIAKQQFGYTNEWVEVEAENSTVPLKITWQGPPDKVKCMPTFSDQKWLPWNESLVDL